jgi:transcription initiation factor TFIIIB Brf1 subunit/transcription initiation factor TFIIB
MNSLYKLMENALGKINPDIEIKTEKACPECKSEDNMMCHGSDIICISCGTNFGSEIDYRPDWRTDNGSGEDMTRCNLPRSELLPQSSLSTCVRIDYKSGKIGYDMKRTMIWNSIPHTERSMRSKIEDISLICRLNNVQDIIMEYAQETYHAIIRALEEKKDIRRRGKNDKGLQAAALFISYQDQHKPKTYKEIAALFNIESKYVSDGINIFHDLLRPTAKVSVYTDFIEEFCDSLNMTREHKERVGNVADKADILGILETNTPASMVAGCIYYVVTEFGLPIKPSEISSRCNVSVPTILKVSEKLFKRSLDLF